MNGIESIPWTGRRWVMTILAALIIQVGLLAWLGRGRRFQSTAADVQTVISLAGDPWLASQIQRLPAYRDPALFALPSLSGFSGSAWLRFVPLENAPRNWTEPAQTLALAPDKLARTFQPLAATAAGNPLLVADRPILRITGTDIFVPNQTMTERSELAIEGSIAAHHLTARPSLPSWANRDILSNSVVQVTLLATGEPFSAVLLSGSGSDQADRYALDFATTTRFTPPNDRRVASTSLRDPMAAGRMIFRWHTLPMITTNLAPGAP